MAARREFRVVPLRNFHLTHLGCISNFFFRKIKHHRLPQQQSFSIFPLSINVSTPIVLTPLRCIRSSRCLDFPMGRFESISSRFLSHLCIHVQPVSFYCFSLHFLFNTFRSFNRMSIYCWFPCPVLLFGQYYILCFLLFQNNLTVIYFTILFSFIDRRI